MVSFKKNIVSNNLIGVNYEQEDLPRLSLDIRYHLYFNDLFHSL